MRVALKDIIRLLKQTGSVGKTAKALGVARSTVYHWKNDPPESMATKPNLFGVD